MWFLVRKHSSPGFLVYPCSRNRLLWTNHSFIIGFNYGHMCSRQVTNGYYLISTDYNTIKYSSITKTYNRDIKARVLTFRIQTLKIMYIYKTIAHRYSSTVKPVILMRSLVQCWRYMMLMSILSRSDWNTDPVSMPSLQGFYNALFCFLSKDLRESPES